MSTVIASIPAMTADWLTAVLRRSRSLPQGHVLSLTVKPYDHRGEFATATVAHLAIQYSADAPGSVPAYFLWKYDT